MNRLSFFTFLTLLNWNMLVAGENTVTQDFDDKYLAWKEYISQPKICVQSTAEAKIDNPFFTALVDIGPAALPLIAAKMEQDPEADVLWQAIERIAKVKIPGVYDKAKNKMVFPDYPTLKPNENVYLHWWKEGRFKTGERFADLDGKWKLLKSEKKDKEAQAIYQQIVDLGIPVLPYLIDEVEQQPGFVAAISMLSGGALSPTATAADCKQWWGQNKQKFELPARSQSNDGGEKK